MDLTSHSLFKTWHPVLNSAFNPQNVSTKTVVWWIGACGHEWETTIASRFYNHTGCPYCSGKKLLPGFNDFASKHPNVVAQWDYRKNKIDPTTVFPHSGLKVWWVCEAGHEWEATIAKRAINGKGNCLKCLRSVPTRKDSLGVLYPELGFYWAATNKTTVYDVKPNSSTEYIWVCPVCSHEWEEAPHTVANRTFPCKQCGTQNQLETQNQRLKQAQVAWSATRNITPVPPVLKITGSVKYWWECSKGHVRFTTYRAAVNPNYGCYACSTRKFVSAAEKQITSFLENQHGLLVVRNDRTMLGGRQELDIYLPQKNIAIEYNGLYWHVEGKKKGKYYHYDKWKACKEQGVQLIQIWEDDWKRNPELIKTMITHKLGLTTTPKVFARNTVVEVLQAGSAVKFLNQNHIQGSTTGSHYLGLVDKRTGGLGAVMVLKSYGSQMIISRFATSHPVVGGFTKLLHYATRVYEAETFVTFSDNTVSDGGLYANNGFVADKELPPDYMYVAGGERKHKFGYRLKRFRNDPGLMFQEGLTESELANLNDIPRIWDAGKTRWVKTV